MKKILLGMLFACQFVQVSHASADPNHTLLMTIHNNTPHILTYDRVVVANPGNRYTIDKPVIHSGETAHITAEKTWNNDIRADIRFKSEKGEHLILYIWDQEQIHMGQPVFFLQGSDMQSIITSLVRNSEVGPRYLTILRADMNLVGN